MRFFSADPSISGTITFHFVLPASPYASGPIVTRRPLTSLRPGRSYLKSTRTRPPLRVARSRPTVSSSGTTTPQKDSTRPTSPIRPCARRRRSSPPRP
jgi:hypothetical protein